MKNSTRTLIVLFTILLALCFVSCKNDGPEVRDGSTIDKAIIVDVSKTNTQTFELTAGDCRYFKVGSYDGNFTFKSEKTFTVFVYNEDKTLDYTKASTTEEVSDQNDGGLYMQIIASADGAYLYSVALN